MSNDRFPTVTLTSFSRLDCGLFAQRGPRQLARGLCCKALSKLRALRNSLQLLTLRVSSISTCPPELCSLRPCPFHPQNRKLKSPCVILTRLRARRGPWRLVRRPRGEALTRDRPLFRYMLNLVDYFSKPFFLLTSSSQPESASFPPGCALCGWLSDRAAKCFSSAGRSKSALILDPFRSRTATLKSPYVIPATARPWRLARRPYGNAKFFWAQDGLELPQRLLFQSFSVHDQEMQR